MTETVAGNPPLIATGVEALDDILRGGLTANRLYLVEGNPGSGKTTLALQFLLQGVRRGERCLFVTLSESEDELRATALSHGWSLEGITVVEVIASEESLQPDARYLDKKLVVDLANVYGMGLTHGDDRARLLDGCWNVQAMREIVHRAQSDNSKCAVRANQPKGDFMHCAIATCGDDHICLLCCCLCRYSCAVVFWCRLPYLHLHPIAA